LVKDFINIEALELFNPVFYFLRKDFFYLYLTAQRIAREGPEEEELLSKITLHQKMIKARAHACGRNSMNPSYR